MSEFDSVQVEERRVLAQPDMGAPVATTPSRTAVIVSTRGRPDIVNALVEQLAEQTRAPAHIFIVGTSAADIARLDRNRPGLTAMIGREGSSSQRNDGLALAGSRFPYVIFLDDDFVPSRFWIERMEAVFDANPDVAGLTGIVLADGTTTAGIGLADAQDMVRVRDGDPDDAVRIRDGLNYGDNMGCNMAFRTSALAGIAFDERLPLYAWLEDADFRSRVEKRGRVVRVEGLWGVHLGHKQGRGRGVTIGYSQVANAIYLAGKGTVPRAHLTRLVLRNLAANLVGSIRPEPFVDRRGRLRGNLLAIADYVRGKVRPERILEL